MFSELGPTSHSAMTSSTSYCTLPSLQAWWCCSKPQRPCWRLQVLQEDVETLLEAAGTADANEQATAAGKQIKSIKQTVQIAHVRRQADCVV